MKYMPWFLGCCLVTIFFTGNVCCDHVLQQIIPIKSKWFLQMQAKCKGYTVLMMCSIISVAKYIAKVVRQKGGLWSKQFP